MSYIETQSGRISLPEARYILPEFEERTSYGFKRHNPYTKLFEDRIVFLGVQVDDASADDDQFGVQHRDDVGDRHSQVHGGFANRFSDDFVTGVCCFGHRFGCDFLSVPVDQFVQRGSLAGTHQPDAFRRDRGAADQSFQAATVAAAAHRAVGNDGLMPEFSGCSERSQSQLTVDRDAASDAGTQTEERHRQIVAALSMTEPQLAQRGDAGIVQKLHSAAELLTQHVARRNVAPLGGHVRQELRCSSRQIDEPRNSHPE